MWNRVDLKMRAKAAVKRNYWSCVAVSFILTAIAGFAGGTSGAQSSAQTSGSYGNGYGYDTETTLLLSVIALVAAVIAIIAVLFQYFVGNVLQVGACKFFVQNQTQNEPVSTIIDPFKSGSYKNVVLTMFLMNLFIGLWTLLLIIPGIVKSYEYRMIPYILAENPGMNRKEAFAISKRMMDGKKWAAFVLDMSFMGWIFLSLFTCGILNIFYVNPYIYATDAELYTANRAIAFEEGYIR